MLTSCVVAGSCWHRVLLLAVAGIMCCWRWVFSVTLGIAISTICCLLLISNVIDDGGGLLLKSNVVADVKGYC